jgi:hypothetical protein
MPAYTASALVRVASDTAGCLDIDGHFSRSVYASIVGPVSPPGPRHPNLCASRRLCPLGTVTKVSVSTRGLTVGVVLVLTITVGIVVAVVRDPRSDAQTENTPAPSSAVSREPSTTASPSASPTTPPAPPLLLPNMRSLRASDLSIEVVGGERRLRFAASLANLGPGPLLLLPRGRTSCPRGQHPAVQVLHRDGNADGVFQRARDRGASQRDVGCMLRHPGHRHWHFDAMAAYSLRRPGTDIALVARNKVSFCLRDNQRAPGQRVVVRREHFGKCSRNSQQGISPGWVDVYKADLNGQWLRLPSSVDNELVCLDLRADPRGQLAEANENDNAVSLAVRIDGNRVRRVNSAPCR